MSVARIEATIPVWLAILNEAMGIELRKDAGVVEEVASKWDLTLIQGRLG